MPSRPDHIQFAAGPGKTTFEKVAFADATLADMLRRHAAPGESMGLVAKRMLADYLTALEAAPKDTTAAGAVDHLNNALDQLTDTQEQLKRARRILSATEALPAKPRRSLSVKSG